MVLRPTPCKPTRQSYCQFLLSSQINYTLTYYSEHSSDLSHDAINRFLINDKVPPSEVWQQVKGQLILSPSGFIVFDDTVLDKSHSHKLVLSLPK